MKLRCLISGRMSIQIQVRDTKSNLDRYTINSLQEFWQENVSCPTVKRYNLFPENGVLFYSTNGTFVPSML